MRKFVGKISDESVVFIVGASRSGTTLLQMSLNAHPALSICGEFHFFDQICNFKKDIPSLSKKQNVEIFSSQLLKAYGMQYIRDAETVVDYASNTLSAMEEPERSYESFFNALINYYKIESNADLGGEKTPETVRYLEDLLILYPNARIIHIIRDPRAVVASLLRLPHNSKSILIHAATWRSDVYAGLRFTNQRPDKCKPVLYENLVANPKVVLEELCVFIGVPFDEKMMSYQASAESMIKNEPWKSGTLKGVYDSSISKWKNELGPENICLVELVTSKILKRLGYRKLGCQHKIRAILSLPQDIYKLIKHKIKKEQVARDDTYTTYFSNARVASNLIKSFFFN